MLRFVIGLLSKKIHSTKLRFALGFYGITKEMNKMPSRLGFHLNILIRTFSLNQRTLKALKS